MYSKGKLSSNLDFSKIILLPDKLKAESLKQKNIYICKDNDYLLRHSTIDDSVMELFAGSNTVQKIHNKSENNLYKPVFDIILDTDLDDDSKLQKIIEILGAQKESDLRNKTNFLYYVYNGGSPSEYENKYLVESFEKYCKTFNDKQYNKCLDMINGDHDGAKQRENLIKLRDAILNE